MREVGGKEFDSKVLKEEGPVLVAFVASWCGSCSRFIPTLDAECKERGLDYVITDISDDDDPIWDRFEINVVPTVLVFRDGKIVARQDGALFKGVSRESLSDLLRTQGLS
ncbi:MAG: thioredoxin family protein [Nitrososphaerales archaeon]